jgi:hypothetical protein
MVFGCEMGSSDSEQGPFLGCSERGNKCLDSKKVWEFNDKMSDYQRHKDSMSWN